MDIGTAMLLSSGLSGLAGLFSGSDSGGSSGTGSGYGYFLNPEGSQLIQNMIGKYNRGMGDYGFGSAAKSGNATLGNMFAQRGIDPTSGVAQKATADMLGTAMAADAQNRFQQGMALANYSPAIGYAQGFKGPTIWNNWGLDTYSPAASNTDPVSNGWDTDTSGSGTSGWGGFFGWNPWGGGTGTSGTSGTGTTTSNTGSGTLEDELIKRNGRGGYGGFGWGGR